MLLVILQKKKYFYKIENLNFDYVVNLSGYVNHSKKDFNL